jgi:pimeloyl-ACP methyl ester carboxylesterase
MRTRWPLIPSTLLIIFSAGQAAFAQQVQVPRFEPDKCAVDVPAGERVECGYLVVHENRASKSKRTIRLPIAILKSDSADPKPDPVLRTLGGPGGSSLRMVSGRRASPWLRQRDMIIFEQRGTRYAQPSLGCPEVDDANIQSAKQGLSRAAARQAEVAAAGQCYRRLAAQGIDLSSYNSPESAADIADLSQVLKLDKINLYGVSYSARLALDVIRYYPHGVRSVVLESTMPPEIDYDEVGVDGVVRSLNVLFRECQFNAECSAAYPDLEKEFYTVVANLNQKPITVPTKDPKTSAMIDVRLDGFDFANWIVDYLFSNEPSATVNAPLVVHRAFTGTMAEPFKRYAGDKLNGSFYSWGMRYSVWCSEEFPFEDRAKIKAQSKKYPGLAGFEVMALPDICSVWKVKAAKPVANEPVTSDIPTLVLAAQYDAYTAPEWGRATAGRLKNSFFFEIPWAGHGPGFSVPCVGSMIADFLNDPAVSPKSECIEKTREQFKFVIK